MSFSVLLSIYYKEDPEHLREALDSIYNQTLIPTEVVMVEDGPLTDELNGILDGYEAANKNFKRVRIEKNGGLGNALNRGLKECSYDLVARMDTDDISYPERFETQVKFMEEHPEVDVCSAWIDEFDNDTMNVTSLKEVPVTHEEIVKYMRHGNPINHPAVIFRKHVVEESGGYQHFFLFEDWYLWIRMYKYGARFANIAQPLLHFRTSRQMFKRRGGLKYAMSCAKFQSELHKLGLISSMRAVMNSVMRGAVYLMPNKLRELIYENFLRRSVDNTAIPAHVMIPERTLYRRVG